MNSYWVQYGIYFVFIVLLQGLVINELQLSVYAYPMVYILVLFALPFEYNVLISFLLALLLGVCVDVLSDTFGLHTSASLFIAYMRPLVLQILKPRDGYDLSVLPTVHDMGVAWFSAYIFIMLFVHHLWFFVLEILRFDLIGLIALKTLVSTILSFLIVFGLQYLLYKPSK